MPDRLLRASREATATMFALPCGSRAAPCEDPLYSGEPPGANCLAQQSFHPLFMLGAYVCVGLHHQHEPIVADRKSVV